MLRWIALIENAVRTKYLFPAICCVPGILGPASLIARRHFAGIDIPVYLAVALSIGALAGLVISVAMAMIKTDEWAWKLAVVITSLPFIALLLFSSILHYLTGD